MKHEASWLLPTPPRSDEPARAEGIRPLLTKLMSGEDLRRAEAKAMLEWIFSGEATDAQIAAALVALAVKGETVDELAGMAETMRARARRLRFHGERFIDTAGTGSSYAKTFNVSTAAAFVIAGAGLAVAKHGSKAATSRSGSADVLSALGVNVQTEPEVAEECLNEIGMCFMFAPLYHPSAARVAGIRRELGVHTTFNLLGPLSNPAGAPYQVVGVWHASLVEKMAGALAALGVKRAWVVHGQDGLDEVTIASRTTVAQVDGDKVQTFEIDPEIFGISPAVLYSLRGGDAEANAATIVDVLEGRRKDEARSLMVANAAAALLVGGVAESAAAAAKLAAESIDSGAAREKLARLAEATNR